MKLAIIYNGSRDDKGIKRIKKQLPNGVVVFFIEEQSIPKIRKQWHNLAANIYGSFDRVLLVGDKLSQVVLPAIATKENNKKASMDNYHGCLVDLDGVIFVSTYKDTNSLTIEYQSNDIQRFLKGNIPTLPLISETRGKFYYDAKKYIYLDIETSGLEWQTDIITSIQILTDTGSLHYFDKDLSVIAEDLYNQIIKNNWAIVGHNLLFDLSFLSILIDKDWFRLPIQDTMLISKARGNLHNNLKHLASKYNTKYHPLSYKLLGQYNSEYALADVLATKELHERWIAKGLRQIDYLSFESLQAFGTARLNGVYVSRDVLSQNYADMRKEVGALENELMGLANIIWTNPNQVAQALLDLGVPLADKTDTGKYSVAASALAKIADNPIVKKYQDWKSLKKLLKDFYGEYGEKTRITPYIFPTMNVLGTETGRTSCSNPNLQQVPLSVRKIFTSRFENGKIGVFDLDRSELVCAVLLSGDVIMAKALLEYDYHKYVASLAFQTPYEQVTKEQRSTAKILTFGALLYGGSAKGIASQTGTQEQIVQDAIINLKAGFSSLTEWQDNQIAIGTTHLRIIDVFGKVRELKLIKEFKFGMGSVKRAAMNTVIQGLSGYVCLILVNYLNKRFYEDKMSSLVVLQVHDEVIIDVHPDEIEQVKVCVKDAFASLDNHEVISKLPGYGLIKPTGDLAIANSWYDAKVA